MTEAVKTKRLPIFTVLGILGPQGIAGLGVVVGILGPHPQSDWFGASVLVPIGIALLAASVLAIVCSILAFVRRERAAFLSALTAVPGLALLVWFLLTKLHLT